MLKVKTTIKHKIELDDETKLKLEGKLNSWFEHVENDQSVHHPKRELDAYINQIIKKAFDKGYKLGKETQND